MQNGDRYVGKVVSLTDDTLLLQSDLLGRLNLPRNKVVLIALGEGAATNLARLSTAAHPSPFARAVLTKTNVALSAAVRSLGSNTNVIQAIRTQFLAAAGPEANAKFDELFNGLLSGKLDLNDIRKQAQSAVDDIKSLKSELGDDAGDSLDGYLAILEDFLKESDPVTDATTNAVVPAASLKAQSAPATK